jgi:hypothetical protein
MGAVLMRDSLKIEQAYDKAVQLVKERLPRELSAGARREKAEDTMAVLAGVTPATRGFLLRLPEDVLAEPRLLFAALGEFDLSSTLGQLEAIAAWIRERRLTTELTEGRIVNG